MDFYLCTSRTAFFFCYYSKIKTETNYGRSCWVFCFYIRVILKYMSKVKEGIDVSKFTNDFLKRSLLKLYSSWIKLIRPIEIAYNLLFIIHFKENFLLKYRFSDCWVDFVERLTLLIFHLKILSGYLSFYLKQELVLCFLKTKNVNENRANPSVLRACIIVKNLKIFLF